MRGSWALFRWKSCTSWSNLFVVAILLLANHPLNQMMIRFQTIFPAVKHINLSPLLPFPSCRGSKSSLNIKSAFPLLLSTTDSSDGLRWSFDAFCTLLLPPFSIFRLFLLLNPHLIDCEMGERRAVFSLNRKKCAFLLDVFFLLFFHLIHAVLSGDGDVLSDRINTSISDEFRVADSRIVHTTRIHLIRDLIASPPGRRTPPTQHSIHSIDYSFSSIMRFVAYKLPLNPLSLTSYLTVLDPDSLASRSLHPFHLASPCLPWQRERARDTPNYWLDVSSFLVRENTDSWIPLFTEQVFSQLRGDGVSGKLAIVSPVFGRLLAATTKSFWGNSFESKKEVSWVLVKKKV